MDGPGKVIAPGRAAGQVRNALFLGLLAAGVTLYRDSLAELATLTLTSELHQHIPLIPLVSGYLLLVERRKIFDPMRWTPAAGLIMVGVAALLWGFFSWGPDRTDRLSAMIAGLVLWTLGSFVIAFGLQALKTALFPLLFLVFVVPLPGFILDPCVTFLQSASVEMVELVFRISGVPFLREGMIFSLPGLDVEVARQCSGIRSSLALVITAILASKLFLRHTTGRLALVLAVLPITVLKNALRIATLSILGSYVDPVFVTGHWLHRSGGIPFFVAGLVLLAPVLLALRRMERKTDRAPDRSNFGVVQAPRS